MAAQQPPSSKRCALQRAMLSNGLRGVLRAGGQEFAAAAGGKRVQRRREPAAVSGEDGEQDTSQRFSQELLCNEGYGLQPVHF